MKSIIYLIPFVLVFTACEFKFEQEVDFNQGYTENKLVVQGVIQPGYPAFVILSNSEPYFSPINSSTIDELYVTDAQIKISNSEGQSRDLYNINDLINLIPNNEVISALDSIARLIPGLYLELPADLNFDFPYNTIGEFGEQFITDARNVYKLNDERARIKLNINNILGSNIKEVKSHE